MNRNKTGKPLHPIFHFFLSGMTVLDICTIQRPAKYTKFRTTFHCLNVEYLVTLRVLCKRIGCQVHVSS